MRGECPRCKQAFAQAAVCPQSGELMCPHCGVYLARFESAARTAAHSTVIAGPRRLNLPWVKIVWVLFVAGGVWLIAGTEIRMIVQGKTIKDLAMERTPALQAKTRATVLLAEVTKYYTEYGTLPAQDADLRGLPPDPGSGARVVDGRIVLRAKGLDQGVDEMILTPVALSNGLVVWECAIRSAPRDVQFFHGKSCIVGPPSSPLAPVHSER